MTIKFYNRKKELNLLERAKKPFLAIIYGRRRIGKTLLSLKFAENKDFIYFFVNPKKSEVLLLQEFSEIVREKLQTESYVRPKNWEEFFSLLFTYKGIVIFDEFQWFLEVNKSIPFIFQKYYDMKNKKPSFIITGSLIGMIKKLFEEEGSPLFKRADVIINLKDFSFSTVFRILEDQGKRDLEKKFKFYLLFGGVPYYYRFIEKYKVKDVETAIKTLVLDELAPLKNEVEEVMVETFKREYRTYLSILLAIAEGKTKMSEIVSYANIKSTSLPYYLKDLISLLGIVERQKIAFKKKHFYQIRDRFYNFWLRYIYKNTSIENKEILFEKIARTLNSFFGWSFELTIRENILRIFRNFEEKMKYYGFKRENNNKESFDIDVLALNNKTKEILFGECKWQSRVNALKIVKELAEKSKYVEWHNKERKESFAIFAKSFSNRINEYEGKRVYCFDLKEIEKAIKKH